MKSLSFLSSNDIIKRNYKDHLYKPNFHSNLVHKSNINKQKYTFHLGKLLFMEEALIHRLFHT